MANQKISARTLATPPLTGSEKIPIGVSGDKAITPDMLRNFVFAAGLPLTDGNGTTANGTAVDLGGPLTEDTSLDGQNLHSFTVDNVLNGGIFANDGVSYSADVGVSPGEAYLSASNADGEIRINVNATDGIEIDDSNETHDFKVGETTPFKSISFKQKDGALITIDDSGNVGFQAASGANVSIIDDEISANAADFRVADGDLILGNALDKSTTITAPEPVDDRIWTIPDLGEDVDFVGATGTMTEDYVLTAHGDGVAPTWEEASGGGEETTYLGTIYNATSYSSTTDFTNAGATVSIVSSAIQFTGGANTFTQNLKLTSYGHSGLENARLTGRFKIQVTGEGFGLNLFSSNTYAAYGIFGKFRPTDGKLYFYNEAGTLLGKTPDFDFTLAWSVNDVIELTLERKENSFILTAWNVNTPLIGPIRIDYTYQTQPAASPYIPNSGYYGVGSYGGTFSLQSLNIFSNEIVGADLMFIGDSKNIYTGSNVSYINLLRRDGYTVVSSGGANDQTRDVVNKLPQLVALAPKKAVIVIGSNDLRAAVSSGTWQANYLNISTTLLAAGIDVYYMLIHETVGVGVDQDPLWTYITSTFPAGKLINLYNYEKVEMADNIHPSPFGHRQAYEYIRTSGVLTNPKNSPSTNQWNSTVYTHNKIRGGVAITVSNSLPANVNAWSGYGFNMYGFGANAETSTSWLRQFSSAYLPTPDFANTTVLSSPSTVPLGLSVDGSTLDFRISTAKQVNIKLALAVGHISTAPTSTLQSLGSFATAYAAKTTTYPLTATDHTIEATTGTFTVTLPTAVGISGRQYFITNSGTGVITLATTSSQTFVNITATPTTVTLNQFQGIMVQSNGANWLKMSSF